MQKREYTPDLNQLAVSEQENKRKLKLTGVGIATLISLITIGKLTNDLFTPADNSPNLSKTSADKVKLIDDKNLSDESLALIKKIEKQDGGKQLLSDINPELNGNKQIKDFNNLANTLKEAEKDCEAPIEIKTNDKTKYNKAPVGEIHKIDNLNEFSDKIKELRLACLTVVPYTKANNGHSEISLTNWIRAEPNENSKGVAQGMFEYAEIRSVISTTQLKTIYLDVKNLRDKTPLSEVFFHEKQHELGRQSLPITQGNNIIAKSILGPEVYSDWKKSGFSNNVTPELAKKLSDIGLREYSILRYDAEGVDIKRVIEEASSQKSKNLLTKKSENELNTLESTLFTPTEIDATAAQIMYKTSKNTLERQTINRYLDLMAKFNPNVDIYSQTNRKEWEDLIQQAIIYKK
jgi:hypothetical protein